MNKIFKICFVGVFAVVLTGCGSSQANKTTKVTKVKKTVDAKGQPLWISNPNINGNNGVVSVVTKYDKKTKKLKSKKKLLYIAKMKARAAFQTKKGTKIDSTSVSKIKNDGTASYSEKVKLSSNSIQIKKLIVKKTFEDDKFFYMWMVEDK
ncbi:MAG: hypothetical protein U9N59_02445 [Campylobacterota bacterium]|nr:hypothetical protein [Campylobacterota bacterium]